MAEAGGWVGVLSADFSFFPEEHDGLRAFYRDLYVIYEHIVLLDNHGSARYHRSTYRPVSKWFRQIEGI